ncbi:hypothetical protein AWN90_02570 [Nocardia terpenica]|uniref:Uncharacterized protein n=1 Tax=Nocardia terpenica TaxID=455432 RepID=A0A164KQD9_9NOCA|nr:hypothetical protein AWN90_02570 [Nocardia terpenica]
MRLDQIGEVDLRVTKFSGRFEIFETVTGIEVIVQIVAVTCLDDGHLLDQGMHQLPDGAGMCVTGRVPVRHDDHSACSGQLLRVGGGE